MEKVFVKLLLTLSLIEIQLGNGQEHTTFIAAETYETSSLQDVTSNSLLTTLIENLLPAKELLTEETLSKFSKSTENSDSLETSTLQAATARLTTIIDNQSAAKEQLSEENPGDKSENSESPTENIETLQDPGNKDCPTLEPNMNLDNLTQAQFTTRLTDSCRYDKLIKPSSPNPLPVFMQIDLTHMESGDQLQFKAQMLVQYIYNDSRLRFEHISPARGSLLGEELLRNKIWVPHVIIRNERDNRIMGADGRDIFVSISPGGEVVYSYRITATFYCWMNLQKFPFDSQDCSLKWNSWTYNASNLILHWDGSQPVKIAPNLHLTEFVLAGTSAEEDIAPAFFLRGSFVGNFSELTFRFKLSREAGYYLLDYFLPSMLLVVTSWVSFWLQADAAPPRVTLGTSTMLAFITLNGGVTKNLPKVSYIKASEIWFLACACFIFCSMAEFAFVNVIWRRKKEVELKRQTSKYILKGALTPSLARKELRKADSTNSLRSSSSLEEDKNIGGSYSTHSVPRNLKVPTITTSQDDLVEAEEQLPGSSNKQNEQWHTMSPHEVANWIDKKSRIVFPLTFLVFNLFYWSFVYVL